LAALALTAIAAGSPGQARPPYKEEPTVCLLPGKAGVANTASVGDVVYNARFYTLASTLESWGTQKIGQLTVFIPVAAAEIELYDHETGAVSAISVPAGGSVAVSPDFITVSQTVVTFASSLDTKGSRASLEGPAWGPNQWTRIVKGGCASAYSYDADTKCQVASCSSTGSCTASVLSAGATTEYSASCGSGAEIKLCDGGFLVLEGMT
jgi:hypothetical protein